MESIINRQDQEEKQISRMENKAETRIYLDICTNKKVNKYDQNFEVWDIFKRPKVKNQWGWRGNYVPNLEKEMGA